MSEERLERIETAVSGLRGDVDGLRRDVDNLVKSHDHLGHRIGLMHEETIETIKALAPDFAPIRREYRAADADLREELDRRIVPLEAFARHQTRDKPPNRKS